MAKLPIQMRDMCYDTETGMFEISAYMLDEHHVEFVGDGSGETTTEAVQNAITSVMIKAAKKKES